ncbi:putative GATA transcription factor 22 [Andrographis paniculata]|uniref:putative GATA transcription factor 22 n=1 Tax=Andrographis paniculata TaxID=175694 RepID=UPI0021E722DC|nr:putative GATA transcription factor 22 [Andrographis paniculata]
MIVSTIALQCEDDEHPEFGLGFSAALPASSSSLSSSSSSSSSRVLFSASRQDSTGYYPHQLFLHHQDDRNYAYGVNVMEDKVKLSLRQLEEDQDCRRPAAGETTTKNSNNNNNHHVSWITTPKMKKPPPSSSWGSNFSSNTPIRVCSDCNTTKTPLWRSGPKGPKSLCNACGIRQRKARRAMMAGNYQKPPAPAPAKMRRNGSMTGKGCRRRRVGSSSSSSSSRLEESLRKLKKKVGFVHQSRVFPEEEKDAAILLMALSSGAAG